MSMRTFTPVRRLIAVVSIATLTALGISACHSSSSTGAPAPTKGGTLNVILSNQAINYLDPQKISLATDSNISHQIVRTLTTTNAKGQLVPDLATDTGRPSPDDTVWEFTLKPGLRWQDGTPVTCPDVKYGIERRFAPTVSQADGLPYPITYLQDNPTPYTGPFAGSSLQSITCVDNSTVQFKLQKPVGDFGYAVSVNTFAPMKQSADKDHKSDGSATSTDYDPFSDGPYEVDPKLSVIGYDKQAASYSATKIVLVRNPYWNPATDPVRKAYPDKIDVTFDANRPQVTNNLIQSTSAQYQNSISLDADVSSQFVQQVINDPDLSARAVSGFAGATRYFAINVRKEPTLGCRQALEYAFDKRSWRFEAGGAVFGDLATSIIPPNLLSHENFDIYDTTTLQDGNQPKALKMWAQDHCPSTVNIAFPNASGIPQQMSTVVRAFQQAGIHAKLYPLDQSSYYASITNPREKYDMTYAGWVPDWANGSAVIPPLFSGAQVAAALANPVDARANNNFSMVDNPSLDAQINDAFKTTDLTTQYHLWGDLDKYIMEHAYIIPVLFIRALRMEGTNVRGATISPAFGQPDLSTIGLGK